MDHRDSEFWSYEKVGAVMTSKMGEIEKSHFLRSNVTFGVDARCPMGRESGTQGRSLHSLLWNGKMISRGQ